MLPHVSQRVDYEAELVAVVGKRGKNIHISDALDHAAGHACGNEGSSRDWQFDKPSEQWFLGKSFGTFAPVGSQFVTGDEAGDPNNLKIVFRLNGQVMQSSNTPQFIFRLE